MGLEKREARPHRAHRPAAPRSSFRDRRTGTPPAPRDTGKGPLILRGPEARLHPPRLRLIPGQPLKNYFRLSMDKASRHPGKCSELVLVKPQLKSSASDLFAPSYRAVCTIVHMDESTRRTTWPPVIRCTIVHVSLGHCLR